MLGESCLLEHCPKYQDIADWLKYVLIIIIEKYFNPLDDKTS